MPKMKTHRGAAKRMRRSGAGKAMRGHAFSSHNFENKSPSRLRRIQRMEPVAAADRKRVDRMLGGRGAKARRNPAPRRKEG
jgi:large subunit ribosomal protein L35